ncbi:hypothetical protein ABDD95_04375 [Mucilaginibacter sp. PAMB04274]|uniref:hypothetical protein n=1 Tax=Mucilaginibacter sp. PAMB04274 TaxID=3138568 RepID=UPI0031F6D244
MKIKDVLTANLVSTTLMTLFSEAVSKADGNTYNEAKILGELLNRITPLNKRQAQIAGWIGHYSVGVGFAGVYAAYLEKAKAKPTLVNGLAYGALSGLAGAFIWHATFKAHPNPPGVNLKTYYKQLVLAHIVFGLSAAVVLKKLEK